MSNDPAAVDAIRAAVDALTQETKQPVERDDGTTTYATVPSLWHQATTALYARNKSDGNGGPAARERNLVDFDLMEVHSLIAAMVERELGLRDPGLLKRRTTVPSRMRALASYVVAHEPDQLWWWEYRFASWARLLSNYLHLGERRPSAVRLRNAACPHCGLRQVVVETTEGERVVPALVIEFSQGLVQAARCGGCGATWWRGVELEQLADALG